MNANTLVVLVKHLTDDRHDAEHRLRPGQLGIVTGPREIGGHPDRPEVWVRWYADQPEQCHTLDEIQDTGFRAT